MVLGYNKHSKFLNLCEQSVCAHRDQLEGGEELRIMLGARGYAGDCLVTLNPTDQSRFHVEWAGKDASRFPSRIRAAVTALRNCGCYGIFRVWYRDGTLTIQRS